MAAVLESVRQAEQQSAKFFDAVNRREVPLRLALQSRRNGPIHRVVVVSGGGVGGVPVGCGAVCVVVGAVSVGGAGSVVAVPVGGVCCRTGSTVAVVSVVGRAAGGFFSVSTSFSKR